MEEAIQDYEDLRKKMDPKKNQKKRGKPSKNKPTANVRGGYVHVRVVLIKRELNWRVTPNFLL